MRGQPNRYGRRDTEVHGGYTLVYCAKDGGTIAVYSKHVHLLSTLNVAPGTLMTALFRVMKLCALRWMRNTFRGTRETQYS